MIFLFIDQNTTNSYPVCDGDTLTQNSKLANNKCEANGNRNLELKAGLFPMDWLNNNALPVWSMANNLSTTNCLANLPASNLPNNLTSPGNAPSNGHSTANLDANGLVSQSNSNQLVNNFTSAELTSLTANPIYSSLLSQNYLIPFLKNAALLANLSSSINNSNTVNTTSTNSLSNDQWTVQNQENESNRKSIDSGKQEKGNYEGK